MTNDQPPVGGILKSPSILKIFTTSYKQLIEGQRYQIQAYLYQGLSYRLIVQKTGVTHSTISREVKQNHLSKSYYDPKQAHVKVIKRRQGANEVSGKY